MLSGISPWSILLILIIVVVLFGTKKVKKYRFGLRCSNEKF